MHEFLVVAIAHFLAVASPGPDFAVVSKVSLRSGRHDGLKSAFGVATGIAGHVTLAALGFGVILRSNQLLFNTVRIVGAAYLLYLGVSILTHHLKKGVVENVETVAEKRSRSPYIDGFITNITNPKATLFFVTIFTQVVSRQTTIWWRAVYGIEMVLATAVWFSIVASLISHPRVIGRYRKASVYIDIGLAVVLIGLALVVIREVIVA